MSNWYSLLYVLGAALLAWLAFRTIKNNPASFTKENMGKSFFTLGILALLLIGFIALLIFLLRQ